MLKNERQNYHHSKMPQLGEIVTIPAFLTSLTYNGKKAIVTSFTLSDNVTMRGIHLVNVELLFDRNIHYTIAGHYLT